MPNPLNSYCDGDHISPWFVEWPDAPGLATDPDGITPEQWERARAARAKSLNPALKMDRMPEGWSGGEYASPNPRRKRRVSHVR